MNEIKCSEYDIETPIISIHTYQVLLTTYLFLQFVGR